MFEVEVDNERKEAGGVEAGVIVGESYCAELNISIARK